MIERDMWTALKSQLRGDTTLSAYVKKFRFTRQEYILQKNMFPLLIAYPTRIINDEPHTLPKNKLVSLDISFFIKVNGTDGEAMEEELLKFDELVKNAIEKDILLGGKSINIKVNEGTPQFLDKEVAEIAFSIEIVSPRFTMGAR